MHPGPQVNVSSLRSGGSKWKYELYRVIFFFMYEKISHVEEYTVWCLHESIPHSCTALVKQITLLQQYVSNFM